jgi:8-amino-7-oxononanoate synthase
MANKPRGGMHGLGEQLKERLVRQVIEARSQRAGEAHAAAPEPLPRDGPVPEALWKFDQHPGYLQVNLIREGARRLDIADPFFRVHDGVAGSLTQMEGRPYVNFSSYNYLGLNGDPRVNAAAEAAIRRYGTSVSASRLVSGERPPHQALERALAEAYGVEACVTFVSGHATNVSTIGSLFGPRDLIVHDALIHNSALLGAQLSGARRIAFPHNDWSALDALLARERRSFQRVLIVLEGLYSMDGDMPELPRFVEIKHRHRAFLMVDEAHSFGVVGRRGLGVREHFGLAGSAVDIWMGTLSKALAGCGGYIAGERALVDIMRHLSPSFVFSVGMPPPVAAASLAALECMLAESWRVAALQSRGREFLRLAVDAGIDTGTSQGYAIVPAITGSSVRAGRLSQAMYERGINVQPILHPAVPENSARLRFFLSSQHTDEQIAGAVRTLAAELNRH